ncbi:MAG TPA: DUF1553 domain-containing protein [Gemmataceae bacterium]|nr:DUF1553 domain-containing protein [Gemmataceae bacterium]
MKRQTVVGILAIVAATAAAGKSQAEPSNTPLHFSRDVLPIFAENCFQCHGPDEKARKAKLRLDTHEGILKVLVPGKSASSELVRRIFAQAGDGGMPPPKANRKLTAGQKETLRRWIDQGATWGKHWAYEAPVRPNLPAVKRTGWTRNPIDFFALAQLEKEGLAPSQQARKETLIRRVTLDLTGLPPTVREIEAFLADHSPNAFEKLVDRLLDSPRFGERMALDWLDDARYADTNGYQNDFARTMWPWRDWVIDAYNRNLPFDRFVVEQLAGDLLPGATLPQRIASGFNRNNRTVTEAGSIDEEWRVENGVDRVETTAAVFLGLTMGCARCHDHKYDPISQKEFYSFYAFFNSINEKGVYTEQRGNVPPLVAYASSGERERLKRFDAEIAEADKSVRAQEAALPEQQRRWEQEQQTKPPPPEPGKPTLRISLNGTLAMEAVDRNSIEAVYRGKQKPTFEDSPLGKALRLDGHENSFVDAGQNFQWERSEPVSCSVWVKPQGEGAIYSKMDEQAAYRGVDLLIAAGNKIEAHFVHTWPENAIKVTSREPLPRDAWSHVVLTYDGSSKAARIQVCLDGRPLKLDANKDHLTDTIATAQPLRLGKRSVSLALKGELADVRFYRRVLTASEVLNLASQPLSRAVHTTEAKRSRDQREILTQVFRKSYATAWLQAKQKADKLRKEKADFEKQIPTVMVMEDMQKPRDTYVLRRGRYEMPDKNQKVEPGVPACLTPMSAALPRNRLGLAEWLVDPANPLTARVAVNRFWQRYFGLGLVKTTENFGVQGEPPAQPELLDWLATEFVRSGWNIKAMQKLIVTSATYRQSSRAGPALLQRDPDNRLLSRGPRFRLPAEVIRDNALAISGLLSEKTGGPSIKPYQPAGLWDDLAGGAGEGKYVQDKGPNLYRRSLYIYRKRTVPHPAMATFDAPSREVCQVKRSRTNTPLQALELLNDVTYVEAARELAHLMLTQGGNSANERLAFAFRRATARLPSPAELTILVRGLARYEKTYKAHPEDARLLIHEGESPVDGRLAATQLAAYTAVAGIILNLDETITKE